MGGGAGGRDVVEAEWERFLAATRDEPVDIEALVEVRDAVLQTGRFDHSASLLVASSELRLAREGRVKLEEAWATSEEVFARFSDPVVRFLMIQAAFFLNRYDLIVQEDIELLAHELHGSGQYDDELWTMTYKAVALLRMERVIEALEVTKALNGRLSAIEGVDDFRNRVRYSISPYCHELVQKSLIDDSWTDVIDELRRDIQLDFWDPT